MPLTLSNAVKLRPSVYDLQKRDTVLSIDDLIQDRIDPVEFFEENEVTEGMKTLMQQAFRRLEGKGDQGTFLLKQAMGGGKTHNLITLGLLAKHPEFRSQFSNVYTFDPTVGPIKVIAFNGRETDHPLGIWGALAEQLGKRDLFKDHYSPPKAPGEGSWRNLFKGERVLVLVDELPPYLHAAHATQVGDSNLAEVTQTALTNLLSALNSEDCVGVCFILTDLEAAYGADSATIANILKTLGQEAHRSALQIDPVRMTSDELYKILRKRLFSGLPNENEIREVAQAYAAAIRETNQMDITAERPEEFATRVAEAYPFHPSMRDLYARFKENPGFQQTRGLIRLMRAVVSKLWQTGAAEKVFLIGAHNFDLSDDQVAGQISAINDTLVNAIAHDFYNDKGDSIAQKLDRDAGNTNATDACKLIFMSSMSKATQGVIGLSINEVITNLAEPGRDLTRLKSEALEKLTIEAWYLHADQDQKFYFKNTENLVAKLNSLVTAYSIDQAKKELRDRLKTMFKPTQGDCYQDLMPLPPLDEINLQQDKVTLVILEPREKGLDPAVKNFWKDTDFRNRIGFLTGSSNTYNRLIEAGKRTKAIQAISDEFTTERRLANDPQVLQANDLKDKYNANFLAAVRETFTTLYYPVFVNNDDDLEKAEILMQFDNNRYEGENQIKELLRQKGKFESEVDSDTFRRKIEARLFTQSPIQWSQIKRRSATNTRWQWHIPSALDNIKNKMVNQDQWRENGGYVEKGPFEAPTPSVLVNELNRDDPTGKVLLRVRKQHGNHIYYEFGAEATTSSLELTEETLETDRLKISFLCVDTERPDKPGIPVEWKNRITVQHKFYNTGQQQMCQLKAVPKGQIQFTTDGSSPINNGGVYNQPFAVPTNARMVMVVAEAEGISSEVMRFDPPAGAVTVRELNLDKAATWRKQVKRDDTRGVYELLEDLKRLSAKPFVSMMLISDGMNFAELTLSAGMARDPEQLLTILESLRPMIDNGTLSIDVSQIEFRLGRDLRDWAAQRKLNVDINDVSQA